MRTAGGGSRIWGEEELEEHTAEIIDFCTRERRQ